MLDFRHWKHKGPKDGTKGAKYSFTPFVIAFEPFVFKYFCDLRVSESLC